MPKRNGKALGKYMHHRLAKGKLHVHGFKNASIDQKLTTYYKLDRMSVAAVTYLTEWHHQKILWQPPEKKYFLTWHQPASVSDTYFA